MKAPFLPAVLFLLASATLFAQSPEDALRYSRVDFGGTARFSGLSGAFGALGADFSTLATNPAGLGLYKGSEMTFSIAPHVGHARSTYNGTSSSDNRVNFGIGNFGTVFSINTAAMPNSGILKNFNIGFGFNRQNDFNNRIYIQGINTENSMMTNYTDILNNEKIQPSDVEIYDPFYIGPAFRANLIAYDSANAVYYCDAPFGGVRQDKTIQTSGAITEMDFSFGANLADKLYLGLTVGVPTINYYESSVYHETRTSDTIPNFISLSYYYDLHTRGTGVNVKLGAIYKPVDWVRLGAAIHTPTWYPSMSDSWATSMKSVFDNPAWDQVVYSPSGYYDYKLRTPFRAIGSLAFIVGRYGVVSADYEYVNYSQARFNPSGDSFNDVNNSIKSTYQSYGNLRFGTEWRIDPLRLRGGFAWFSNPYTNDINNQERFQISGGIGFRSNSFFADVTYVYSRMKQSYYMYDPAYVNPADIINTNHTVTTTVGVRF